jgi:hypothetical protein
MVTILPARKTPEVTNFSIDKPIITWYTFPCSIVWLRREPPNNQIRS